MVLSFTLLFAFAAVATAEDKTQVDVYDRQELVKSVVFVIGSNEYFVNGQTPGVKMDARPFIENSRTFVPIRYLSNALGVVDKHIGWESPTVTLDQPGMPVVELSVGQKQIKSDGQAKAMDVAPLLRKGRTYLPARFVAEALGYHVGWDSKNNAVICWPKGTEQPDISNVVDYVNGESPGQPVEEPVTPTVPEQPPVNTDDVIQFRGKRLNPDDYEAHGGWAIPYEFKQPGASIMYVTVDELRQKPVKLGNDEEGYMIFYDVKVTEDKVYVTQADGSRSHFPAPLVLAKGNDVSVQRDNTIVEYDKIPFTHGYYVSLEADPGGGTKIENVTDIMLLFDNQILAVENPLYEGASK
jgi:hypothetical protein